MKKLFALLVILVLLLPAAYSLFNGGLTDLSGNFLPRNKALNDALVSGWGWVNGLLGDSGSPQVVKGRSGWLYFREALNDSLQEGSMAQADLVALADNLQDIKQQLEDEGTRFVLLIAPDKAAVHPEHLPYYMQSADVADSNRARLLGLLKERSVTAPDLNELLKDKDTYFRTDTHWNAHGAYLAFEAMLASLNLENPYQFNEEDFVLPTEAPGDLVPLYLPAWRDDQQDFLPELPRSYRSQRPLRSLDDLLIQTSGKGLGPSMFVARDSFGRAFFPYAADYASRLLYVRGYNDFAEQAKDYDIAVLLIAQRSLNGLEAQLIDFDDKER